MNQAGVRIQHARGARYNDVDASGNWSVYDVTAVDSDATGFVGAVFDGRYVYFLPYLNAAYHGHVTRYDTLATFTSSGSWAVYDVTAVDSDAKGFHGGVFDGRYIYLIPYSTGSVHGHVTRYDTQASFTDSGSWSVYDITAVDASAKGYMGGTFDGRYLYLAPYNNGSASGYVARYDTEDTFADSGSWSVYDISAVDASAEGFRGAVYDGQYVYFIPLHNGAYHGHVMRYDTEDTFADSGSWSVYDVSAVDAGAIGFFGGVFDGRYLYLVPYHQGSFHGHVARYDTTASFTSSGSWAVYDVSAVDTDSKGFVGAVFDGRYVYFVPYNSGSASGHVTRYDTEDTFADSGSWTVYDIAAVDTGAKGFMGGAFDGRYMYLAPRVNGTYHGHVARLNDKMLKRVPTTVYGGSFF